MLAGYDYMLLRNHLQRRLVKLVGFSLVILGGLLLISGGAYFAYASKANSNLTRLNVPDQPTRDTSHLEAVLEPNIAVSVDLSAGSLLALPIVQSPPSVFAGEEVSPVEPLERNPSGNELPPAGDQTLVSKFTPMNLNQALPVGSQAAPIRILVPSIGVDSGVTQLAILDQGNRRVYETPKNSVGHIPESANPGEAGSSWFFGHLDSPIKQEGAVFHALPKIPDLLHQGEKVYVIIDNGAQQFLYLVTSTQVVHQEELKLYNTGQANIHLVACVPSLVYDHRLIVTGQLVGTK